MRAGIFDPYLDTLGGGERYTLTLVEYLLQKGSRVDIFWNDPSIIQKAENRFNLNLKRVNFVDDIFYSKKNLLRKWQITRKYDLFFWLSDGSLPFLFAQKNILHFQVPFQNVGGRSFLNRIKLKNIHQVICNSSFTKKYIDQEYGVKSGVIYPPVAVEDFKSSKKENLILSVGRFSRALHPKKQHILINEFKRMIKTNLSQWRLVLVGGAQEKDRSYLKKLERMAKGWPIDILTNVDFKTLQRLYEKAKIFWHAAGFDEDEEEHPEKMEHFGIAVVEAMAAGCVPVVVNKGGLPEIVAQSVNGFLWETKQELVRATFRLVKSSALWQKLSRQVIKDSQRFSKKVFCQKIDELVKN